MMSCSLVSTLLYSLFWATLSMYGAKQRVDDRRAEDGKSAQKLFYFVASFAYRAVS